MKLLKPFVSKNVLLRNYIPYVNLSLFYGLLISGCRSEKKPEPIHFMRKEFNKVFLAKSVIIFRLKCFKGSELLSVYEFYCFELIKISLKSFRQETPSSYLNNLYDTIESTFQARNTWKGLLTMLKCENIDHMTSFKLRGTKQSNFSLKRLLIHPNVFEHNELRFTKIIGKLRFVFRLKGWSHLSFQILLNLVL